ncbi:ankyrin repeat-containing protein, putative [Ricinus communis]|uniref:Ankyrin repeat-containing protein, putative n=2 Tax=Ricinus communis TaxID=3988 RepID=B9SK91_RICCO|nr:ankyrin repeat-containing protein, putative [Ricinus communis]
MKFTKLLVSKDTSWEASSANPDIGTISFGEVAERARATERGTVQNTSAGKTIVPPLTPLLIASSNGIIEIVEEILQEYPQAVEHVSDQGQNILHVAVKHRKKEIFRRVKKMKIPMAILVRKMDINGYTLLHHAADMHNYFGGYKPSPVLQLQEELRWYERVKKIIPSHYIMHHNGYGQTALELFEETHSKLHKDAQEWLKRTSESCSVIAVLIATVAFTAIYTVPGGNDDKTGLPVLLRYPFFSVFTILDIISLASSLTSVVMFLSILTSPFQLQDFRISLPRKLTLGFTFLFFSGSYHACICCNNYAGNSFEGTVV